MKDTIKAVEELKKPCDTVTEWVKAEICKGADRVDAKELGEAVDMVKDFAQAKMYMWQMCFYKLMCEELQSESYQDDRMGYRGGRRGYQRFVPPDDMMAEYNVWRNMGYNGSDNQNGSREGSQSSGYRGQPRNSYGEYMSARRRYTETRDEQDREEMSASAERHLKEVERMVGEMWKEADPQAKARMKAEIGAILNSMN